jgi:hypothetical protein
MTGHKPNASNRAPRGRTQTVKKKRTTNKRTKKTSPLKNPPRLLVMLLVTMLAGGSVVHIRTPDMVIGVEFGPIRP